MPMPNVSDFDLDPRIVAALNVRNERGLYVFGGSDAGPRAMIHHAASAEMAARAPGGALLIALFPGKATLDSEQWFRAHAADARNAQVFVVDDIEREDRIRTCLDAISRGTQVIATMEASSVSAVIGRLVMFHKAANPRSPAIAAGMIAAALRVVSVGHELPRAGGGTVTCREFVVLDEDRRSWLLTLEETDRITEIELMMAEGEFGSTREGAALRLLADGLITERTFEEFTAPRVAA